jgi:hypothetical protein
MDTEFDLYNKLNMEWYELKFRSANNFDSIEWKIRSLDSEMKYVDTHKLINACSFYTHCEYNVWKQTDTDLSYDFYRRSSLDLLGNLILGLIKEKTDGPIKSH